MNKTISTSVAVAVLSLLTNCATVTQGSSQTIYFDTAPTGAECDLMREGNMLYSKVKTPITLEIEKDKDDLMVICRKEGYKETQIHTSSDFEGWALGNLFLGGIIGVGIDAASGALNEYPNQVLIPLEKE